MATDLKGSLGRLVCGICKIVIGILILIGVIVLLAVNYILLGYDLAVLFPGLFIVSSGLLGAFSRSNRYVVISYLVTCVMSALICGGYIWVFAKEFADWQITPPVRITGLILGSLGVICSIGGAVFAFHPFCVNNQVQYVVEYETRRQVVGTDCPKTIARDEPVWIACN